MSNKNLLNNQRGSIAIVMVLSAVAILTPLIVNFTFDTAINKLKTSNKEDKYKSRLMAESGLKFAMARLRLYKEAYNFVQKNESAKDIAKPEVLNMIWNFPFVYPIPIQAKMNSIQKEAIKDFTKSTLLEGGLNLTINNISNKLNLNMLRISILNAAIEENDRANAGEESESESSSSSEPTAEEEQEYNIDNQLFKSLTNAIEDKSTNDEDFSAEFYGKEVSPLVNELKFFVSDEDSLEESGGAQDSFSEENKAKHGPLTSFSEIYTLPSWPDEIINLVKNEYTVHGALMVDLNKITDKLLKILIPDITPEDIDEFFKYKNDEDDPKYFNTKNDFKNYIVNIGNIMNESDFDDRIAKFEKQGIRFGPSPTLFKIVSTGNVGRASYNLTAFVTMPAQPSPRPKKKNTEDDEEESSPPEQTNPEDSSDSSDGQDSDGDDSDDGDSSEQKTLLLNPRIVEILIN